MGHGFRVWTLSRPCGDLAARSLRTPSKDHVGTHTRDLPESAGNLEPSEINTVISCTIATTLLRALRSSSEPPSSYTSSLSSTTQVLTRLDHAPSSIPALTF